MAEQIGELRRWVSNPNGGRTDKVSVLQDAVSFVKDANRRIEELETMVSRLRMENTHLRTMVDSTQTQLTATGVVQPLSSLPGMMPATPGRSELPHRLPSQRPASTGHGGMRISRPATERPGLPAFPHPMLASSNAPPLPLVPSPRARPHSVGGRMGGEGLEELPGGRDGTQTVGQATPQRRASTAAAVAVAGAAAAAAASSLHTGGVGHGVGGLGGVGGNVVSGPGQTGMVDMGRGRMRPGYIGFAEGGASADGGGDATQDIVPSGVRSTRIHGRQSGGGADEGQSGSFGRGRGHAHERK